MFDYSRKNKRWRNLRKLVLRRDRGFCRFRRGNLIG